MKLIAFGDRALLINFDQKIDPIINDEVISLMLRIQKAKIIGLAYCIPAYCSLTIGYDPQIINFETLSNKIKSIPVKKEVNQSKKTLEVPVLYQKDMGEVQAQTKLSANEITQLHTSITFRVYLLGFLPGFAYMGKLPDKLFCERKNTPDLKIAAGSVGLAGHQTGIYPFDSPGGWQIIGKTPIKIFDIEKENPFFFQAGDSVQFKAINEAQFNEIKKNES